MELIRYIHLNPLRAKLVNDLKELDKYPWTGHSAILGRCKNPFPLPHSAEGGLFFQFRPETEKDNKNPRNPCNPCQKTSLAEKTIEDVLLHFGETKKTARRRYRQFVKNGVDQGKRPEFQGGGLVRSSGGNKAGLLGRKKEEREKGDARILGSGDFVSRTLHESNRAFEKRNLQRPTIKSIIDEVISHFKISPVALFSGSRNGQLSKARAIISYLTVIEAGYTQKEVSTGLNVSRIAVRNSLQRVGKYLDTCKQIWAKIG